MASAADLVLGAKGGLGNFSALGDIFVKGDEAIQLIPKTAETVVDGTMTLLGAKQNAENIEKAIDQSLEEKSE